MACISPIQYGYESYPCKRCWPCLQLKRQEWTDRCLLESKLHAASVFATLTYSDDEVPRDEAGRPILDPREHQLFLKRLRKMLSPQPLRFFQRGEYGSRTFRPHHHYLLFGVSYLQAAQIESAWGRGFTDVKPLTPENVAYTVGYVVDKLDQTHADAISTLPAEFTRMSTRPALGTGAAERFGQILRDTPGSLHAGDISGYYRQGGKKHRLGEVLSKKVRAAAGIPARQQDRPWKPKPLITDDERRASEVRARRSQSERSHRRRFLGL